MTIHLSSAVVHGHFSNEIPGLITGLLQLAGHAEPLQIQVQGSFLRDIAGCRIDFTNPLPNAMKPLPNLRSPQIGIAGEFTASRRTIKLPRSSRTTFVRSTGLKNLLFFEWFNDDRQRIVLQSWHWMLKVSAPVWALTREQEQAQIKAARALRKDFLIDRTPRSDADAMFRAPGPDDPFAPQTPVQNPFQELQDKPLARKPAPLGDRDDPFSSVALSVKIAAAALGSELRDLETLLGVVPRVQAREALLDLISSISDLSAQMRQTMYQLSTLRPELWPHLGTDVEQSLPLFGAAASACEAYLSAQELSHPGWWQNTCTRLRQIVTMTESLLDLLRTDMP